MHVRTFGGIFPRASINSAAVIAAPDPEPAYAVYFSVARESYTSLVLMDLRECGFCFAPFLMEKPLPTGTLVKRGGEELSGKMKIAAPIVTSQTIRRLCVCAIDRSVTPNAVCAATRKRCRKAIAVTASRHLESCRFGKSRLVGMIVDSLRW
jgi:hypothetical protein